MTEKIRKKKKRRKKHWFLRFFLLIVACVSIYMFLSSEIFDIDRVAVENNKYYTVEQIKAKAGVKIGQNIFRFRTGELKKLLLKDPYFENVTIKRKLPATIIINVQERKEAAVLGYKNGFAVLDKNGLVLRLTKDAPKVTEVVGLNVISAKAGKPLKVNENSMLTDVLHMLRQTENSNLFFKKIDVSNIVVRAYVYDKLICEGTPENITASIENGNLETALYEMYTKGIERGVLRIGSDNYCSFDPNVE